MLILICILILFVVSKLKNKVLNEDFTHYDKVGTFLSFLYFQIFIFLFVIFYRFWSFKRQILEFNILFFLEKIDFTFYKVVTIFAIFLLFINCQRLLIFYFKISFLRLHYYLMRYNVKYYCFFYSCVDLPRKINIYMCKRGFSMFFVSKLNKLIYFMLKYGASIFMVNVFFYEMIFNHMTLHKILVLAPYYASYQMLFLSSYFLLKKMINKFDVDIVEYMFMNKADTLKETKKYYFPPRTINFVDPELKKYILEVLKKY